MVIIEEDRMLVNGLHQEKGRLRFK